MLSLGHGLFFALGGYAMGMYLMRQAAGDGLPAFMVFLTGPSCPGTGPAPSTFLGAVPGGAGAGLLALVFGFFAFRSRIKGVYFSIMTQALTFAGMLLFFRNETGFGGNNGFTNFRSILGFDITAPGTRAVLFLLTVGLLLASLYLCWRLTRSKFGLLTAVRDAENRLMFCGYDPRGFKLLVWVLSAVLCGLAGRCTCRRWASSTPAKCRRPTPSKPPSGWPGRARHADRAAARRRPGQWHEELVHRGLPGVLAVLPRRAVHLVTLYLPKGVVGLLKKRSQP
jgi:urea transport system permease protein